MGIGALATIAAIFNMISNAGYVIAGGIFLKTGVQYLKDYKESIQHEKDGW